MDQVKVYLALMQKHHFWVISGLVLVLSLASWFMASSRLQAEFDTNKATEEAKLATVKGIASTPDHPNVRVTDKMDSFRLAAADNVYQAWLYRYKEQLKVPQWPEDVFGRDFVAFIEKAEPEQEISIPFRELYQNYIRLQIDDLIKSVNLREPVEIEPMGGAAGTVNRGLGGQQGPMEYRGLVAWNETDRAMLRARYDWNQVPTTMQVRFANEDLWVYRALLDIIKQTNKTFENANDTTGEPITEHLMAHIKKIEALNIGQNVQPSVQFYMPQAPAAGEGLGMEGAPGMPGEAGLMPEQGLMPEGGGLPGEAGEMGLPTAANLKDRINGMLRDRRYVDPNGVPLSVAATAPFAEFKIMPFQMHLIMDQRKIPQLLVNCANSPLPVEVRQVNVISGEQPVMPAAGTGEGRMNQGMPGLPGEGGFQRPGAGMNRGFGGEGGIPGFGGGGGGRGRMPTVMPGGEMGAAGGMAGSEVELRPYDLQVEVRGVIYIFNKPDPSKVGAVVPPILAEAAATGQAAAVDPAAAGNGAAAPAAPPQAPVAPPQAPAEPPQAPAVPPQAPGAVPQTPPGAAPAAAPPAADAGAPPAAVPPAAGN